MKIIITGCSGFIGSTIGHAASERLWTVLGIGRSAQAPPGWAGEYVALDAATADLAPVLRDFGPDAVMHASGSASVAQSIISPMDDWRASAMTWMNLLDSVRRSGRRPLVIFPSSAAVYGNPVTLPVAEAAPVSPVSPYGFHKAACELLGREYAECFGLHILALRIFSLFGSAQHRLLIWEVYQQFRGHEAIVWLEGTGAESRDYLSIDDFTDAVLQLIQAETPRGQGFAAVNVGGGEETCVLTLARMIGEMISSEKRVECRGRTRAGDPLRWAADITRLRTMLPEWEPRSLISALRECVGHWHAERPELGVHSRSIDLQ